ncbi:pyridoxal-phosphate dependent enzyme [Litorisediminicola beolgyonensis]|uniref:Pyridoxal-phosphate dependent enzyme n=1 Tax=Litorisediminicola beolgyonensis TaxID=1173614 RepID=A0ABW3ZG58_9RHOB
MPDLYDNPLRGHPDQLDLPASIPLPEDDPAPVEELLSRCPAHAETPLVEAPGLAEAAGIGALFVKDERDRMGLGSFKALGAAHVIARAAVETGAEDLTQALTGETYVTASAGNHGLSVAAGARVFGAKAVVYLSDTVPHAFALRLEETGAEVVRAGKTYEASMDAAAEAAQQKGWRLLSDSSWEGYTDPPRLLMQGYLALMAEVARQIGDAPSHVFVQAGVGGLAAAVAAAARRAWGDAPRIVIVEPTAAPCIAKSLSAGMPVLTEGPVSTMGRLDCKAASLIALKGLARDADAVVLVSDGEVADQMARIADAGLETTPSGGAGLAALLTSDALRDRLGLTASSRALAFVTETA